MSDDQTINFTREAFLHPLNLGVLLIAVISAFATSDIGMLSSLILTLAFGVELMYLGIVPRLPRFRKNVKIKKRRERDPADKARSAFLKLDSKSQKRFLTLKHLDKLIKENFDKLPYSSQGLLESIRKKMKELITNYLTLLDLHKRYQFYMHTKVEESLKEEVRNEEKNIEGLQSDRLKQTRVRRLAILKKRLKKFEAAREKYLICETHLETIEDAIHYIYEQSVTMSNPEEIGFQLDNLLEEVEETSQLIGDMESDILPLHSDLEDFELDMDFSHSDEDQKTESKSTNTAKRVKE